MIGKRGSIIDIAFLLVVAVGLGIFILVVGKVFPTITHQIKGTEIGNNPSSVTALNMTEKIAGKGDMIFMFIFVGLSLAVFISAFFIESSPILIPIYIIALAMLLVFAIVAENVYEKYMDTPTFSQVASKNKITNYIMSHLIVISIGIAVLSMVLMFAKPRGGYGGPF